MGKAVLILLAVLLLGRVQAAENFWNGADVGYALDMEKSGAAWRTAGSPADLFEILHRSGFDAVRIRLWTGDDGVNGLHYATEMALRAQKQGLRPLLVVFLSEGWSDYVKQPAPEAWKSLSFEEKLRAVETYAERVARHFAEHGVAVDHFEIGNEIDFGLCGEFEEEWSRRFSVDHMRSAIWPRAARIIHAAQSGIRKVRPDARFVLHLTQWWNPEYCAAFFRTMLERDVTVDFAGLSFFPTSGLSKKNSIEFFANQTGQLYEAVRRPVWICEYAYPSQTKFTGQFAAWNKSVPGYTLDLAGQAAWVRDFLAHARSSSFIEAAFYWSPEWYPSDMWSAFSLFDSKGDARPALSGFGK